MYPLAFPTRLFWLHEKKQLSGADFIAQLKVVTARSEFHPLVNEPEIFAVGGKGREDYSNLINAASKAVVQGYRVFILPTPKGIRMADFILVRKGVYKLFELKTISGKSFSVSRSFVEGKDFVKMFMKRYLR